MGKTLVLAEKPSVGRELAKYLGAAQGRDGFLEGERYIVTWALGHLVTLAEPEEYDARYKKWDLETLPMLPEKRKLVVIPETGRQFRVVQSLLRRPDVSELVIATDAGREGELVARWIMEKAGWKGQTRRLWISSQTEKAIRDGFRNLRPAAEFENLYQSAEARSQADWLVGLNVTRALTCRYGASLSAGRVQTPTLAMLAAREEQIRHFVPKTYYTVSVKAEHGFMLSRKDSVGGRIADREQAEALAARLSGAEATVERVEKVFKQTPPPAAYDLTELQRDANRKYAYSAKETLSLLQNLYERHKVVTYPRTDSRYIPEDVVPTLPERLQSLRGGPYNALVNELMRKRPIQTRFLVNNAKVTDHHAILPTEQPPEYREMSGPEQNIYDLVARRFLAVLLQPMEYEDITLTLKCQGETLTAKGRRILQEGWKAAYGSLSIDEDEAEEEEKVQNLPALTQGQRLRLGQARVNQGQTKPPARYTEAMLLSAMEHPGSQVEDKGLSRTLEESGGLGTPATRADIIEKLLSAFYVERNGKTLIPTQKGMQVVSLAPEELRSPELTARWERRLSDIAAGKEQPAAFIKEMRDYAAQLVSLVRAGEGQYVHDNVSRERCPDCGKLLLEVKGKKGGKMLVCPDRECGYRRNLSVQTQARCPNCHKCMELRGQAPKKGEADKRLFVCVCGYRERMADFEKRRGDREQGNKREVQRYLARQPEQGGNTALAEALKKWQENNGN